MTRPVHPLMVEIDRCREEAGCSVRELHRRTGISLGHVWTLLHGECGPTLYTLEALAAAFDLEVCLRPRQVSR